MADLVRIQVLMTRAEADRFDAYCREKGYKKSPLIARLIREHLDDEAFHPQSAMLNKEEQGSQES